MKKTMLLAVLTVISGVLYTHSFTFLEPVYKDKSARACGVDPFCTVGAEIVKYEAINCMQRNLISWSNSTFYKCIDEAADKFIDKNKKN